MNAIMPIISQPFFNFEGMKGKSLAAAFLANWVVNIVTYNTIYRKVKPLMDKFAEASESKAKADSNLAQVMERVREINGKLRSLVLPCTMRGADRSALHPHLPQHVKPR